MKNEAKGQGHLPVFCPSCGADLRVAQLTCLGCETSVSGNYPLPALLRLSNDDQQFVLSFILSSGSLKEMAKLCGVSYPTVRNRLDDLIANLGRIIEVPQ